MVSTYGRLTTPPRQSFFLFGVRGVGKSTWARETFPDATYIDLLDERLYQDLLADPSLFAQSIGHLAPGDWVIVDEVQRLPALLNEVHRFIETRRLRFALLGSSARKLRAAGVNLLAGRALKKTMFPLTAAELGGAFDLDRVLRYGSVPLVWTSEAPRDVLEAYVQLYLREEIRAEALVRNLPGFVRFLPVAALFNGQVINIAGIARDAGVARTTVQGYLDILEDTLLVCRLPACEARARVRERRLPKLYWVDPGIVRAVKRQLGPVTPEERGPLLETWVLTTLRAHAEVQELYDELSYWAPHQSQAEVDVLLQREREFLAIEVKSTDRYHTGLLKGLRACDALPRLARRVLVYTGHRSFVSSDGIEVWPAGRFAAAVAEGRLWP
ncbi:MAG: AAA family ATPase [Acidobacteria bacterium]|nr:AAA family ATPase [Acidobacteriota bacterium]